MNYTVARIIRLGWSVGLAVVLSGCQLWPFMSDEDGRKPSSLGKSDQVLYPNAPQPVHLSENFGEAFRAARDNQILYPEASKNLDLVTGKDGTASRSSIDLYRKSYAKPSSSKGASGGGKK